MDLESGGKKRRGEKQKQQVGYRINIYRVDVCVCVYVCVCMYEREREIVMNNGS